ncbi:hypothetical protein BU15DRAFT_67553 [Melanogaster broomeanus]|nr:hypothetical protein BU15DRAFT_67553 [Melanogaster broomeanus]
MSSASKSITPAPSMLGVNWAHLKTPELNSDIEDNDETAMAKAKECRQRKVEKKHCDDKECCLQKEAEKHHQEEEEQHCWKEVERHQKREEEQREREKVQRKATEANKKRQREEIEAGPSVACILGMCCLHCTWAGVPSQREKCKWPEMHAPGARKGKGKAKEVPMLPCQAVTGQAGFVIEEMSDQMGELAQAHRESMQAHRESMQAHRESTQASRKARKALEAFVDKAAICGMPEESADESTEEEANKGEIEEELAGLQEDEVENPISPKKVGYKNIWW